MQFKITEIKQLKFSKTHFYSIRFLDRDKSEFKEFYERIKPNDTDFKEALEIINWFSNWANYEGALEEFFREEREADRLFQPMEFTIKDDDQTETNLGLRWYCYRYNQNVVVLFNGGRKTHQDPEKCDNVRDYFLQAIAISKTIDEAFQYGILYIENDFELKTKPGSFLKI